jgi:protein SCO1/2
MVTAAAALMVGALVTSWIITRTAQSPSGGAPTVTHDRYGYAGTLLDPPIPRPALRLPDTEGRLFDLRNRPVGEVTVVLFGYTNCGDVCPTTVADLAAARRVLRPAARQHVTVVFVTEDPSRDTPTVLRAWLNRFDASILGLIRGNDTTKQVLTELHLPESLRYGAIQPGRHTHRPNEPAREHAHGNDYEVEHSGVVYAFGPKGRTVLYTGGTTPPQYAADFARLLRGQPTGVSTTPGSGGTVGPSQVGRAPSERGARMHPATGHVAGIRRVSLAAGASS